MTIKLPFRLVFWGTLADKRKQSTVNDHEYKSSLFITKRIYIDGYLILVNLGRFKWTWYTQVNHQVYVSDTHGQADTHRQIIKTQISLVKSELKARHFTGIDCGIDIYLQDSRWWRDTNISLRRNHQAREYGKREMSTRHKINRIY